MCTILFLDLTCYNYFTPNKVTVLLPPCSDIDIHLDEFRCPYNATDFSQCTANDWGDVDCDHSEDVLLMCGM